jgi:hypothetical protein
MDWKNCNKSYGYAQQYYNENKIMNTKNGKTEKEPIMPEKKPSLGAGIIGTIAAFLCAFIPTLFWFSGGLSGEHAFALLFPIIIGIFLMVIAAGYALVNGIIWALIFGKKSWRGAFWMALSLGGAFLIPILPILILFLINDWQSCLKAMLVPVFLIGFVVLVGSLLRRYDKSLVLSAFTLFFLGTGSILAISGFILSVLDAVNTPSVYILMLIGGIGLGIIGLGFGGATFFVYVITPRKHPDSTPLDPPARPDEDIIDDQTQKADLSHCKLDARTVASILGVCSCLLGIGFVGIVTLINAVIALIWWLFKDFSPVIL